MYADSSPGNLMSSQENKVAAHARARSREAPPPCSPRHTMIGSRVCTFSLVGLLLVSRRQLQPTMTLTLRTKTTAIERIPVWMTPMTRREARNACSGQHFHGRESEDDGERVSGVVPAHLPPPPPLAARMPFAPHLLHACHLQSPLHSFRFVFSDRDTTGCRHQASRRVKDRA